jgi:hypothetical protein
MSWKMSVIYVGLTLSLHKITVFGCDLGRITAFGNAFGRYGTMNFRRVGYSARSQWPPEANGESTNRAGSHNARWGVIAPFRQNARHQKGTTRGLTTLDVLRSLPIANHQSPITRSPDGSITRSPDHPMARWPDGPITRFLRRATSNHESPACHRRPAGCTPCVRSV